MEATIAKLGETWACVEFIMEAHAAGSDVSLVKLSEDAFEQLEADQLAVQNLLASRFLATFETAVTAWYTSLATVAEVTLALGEIQVIPRCTS